MIMRMRFGGSGGDIIWRTDEVLRKVAARCGIARRRWADDPSFCDNLCEPSAGDRRHVNSLDVLCEFKPATCAVSAERINDVSEKAVA
jgi:hypothetical protein